MLVKDDLKEEVAGLKQDLVKYKTDLINWMCIFWIGQVAVNLDLFYYF